MSRVSGVDLMTEVLRISEARGYSHYFYGSTPETIGGMKKAILHDYPKLNVKSYVSPPFRPLTNTEFKELVDEIDLLQPTFFWCGLGAPKQEILISRLSKAVNSPTIFVGVGLAFNYLAGNVRRAPVWMQRCGLEGLYMNAQQPFRFRRFAKPLSLFVLILAQACWRRCLRGSWENDD